MSDANNTDLDFNHEYYIYMKNLSEDEIDKIYNFRFTLFNHD